MLFRILFSAVLIGLWSFISFAVTMPATIISGQVAGKQFEANDQSYVVVQSVFGAMHGINLLITAVFLLALIGLWARPVRDGFKKLGELSIIVLALLAAGDARAYYNQSDYTENYFILPNESAFFIPDVGDNKSSQASFGSEAYLSEKKIPAKRFEIPHTKLSNSGLWSNYYVPTGRLIIVDRSPVSREWVKHPTRGTSDRDQSFPCQSSEGLDISVGVAVGASVYEENAAKFLFRFGVNAPNGDRKNPEVIFTSVYDGKSLAQVMDGPVRSRVQSLVCDEMTARTLDQDNKEAAKIMAAIEAKVKDYMATVGITLDFIGWADTFGFSGEVQAAIDRKYIASQDLIIAQSLAPHTTTLQSLATAEATRTLAGKWNGIVPTSMSVWLTDSLSGIMGRMFGAASDPAAKPKP